MVKDYKIMKSIMAIIPKEKAVESNGMKVAEYAFAVNKGIIRGVYGINESMWRERREGDRDYDPNSGKKERWGFPDCKPAPELAHYLNTSVKHLFKNGDASSVRFFNCK
jgi:hypothetical protein